MSGERQGWGCMGGEASEGGQHRHRLIGQSSCATACYSRLKGETHKFEQLSLIFYPSKGKHLGTNTEAETLKPKG